jgi:hypothetical protein
VSPWDQTVSVDAPFFPVHVLIFGFKVNELSSEIAPEKKIELPAIKFSHNQFPFNHHGCQDSDTIAFLTASTT